VWVSESAETGAAAAETQEWRGQRLGLPRNGAGSVAGFGRRIVALVVDWLPCTALAQLLTENPAWSALVFFALLTVASVAIFGRTPGHAVAGIRVATLDGGIPSLGAAVVRTALICLALIPAVIYNVDGRGLHDRAAGTVVLIAGKPAAGAQ
jgi:uncharacterized RDD family membrane protein YckC